MTTQLEEPIRLEFSNKSVRRTTAQVDCLGIFYSVSSEDGITSVRRWEQRTDTEVLIGQINFQVIGPSTIRFGEEKQWGHIRDFLRRKHGGFLSTERSFTGSNGTEYRWCSPWRLLLCPSDGNTENPLAIYHSKLFSKKSYIEILDKSLLETLDLVVNAHSIILDHGEEAQGKLNAVIQGHDIPGQKFTHQARVLQTTIRTSFRDFYFRCATFVQPKAIEGFADHSPWDMCGSGMRKSVVTIRYSICSRCMHEHRGCNLSVGLLGHWRQVT